MALEGNWQPPYPTMVLGMVCRRMPSVIILRRGNQWNFPREWAFTFLRCCSKQYFVNIVFFKYFLYIDSCLTSITHATKAKHHYDGKLGYLTVLLQQFHPCNMAPKSASLSTGMAFCFCTLITSDPGLFQKNKSIIYTKNW